MFKKLWNIKFLSWGIVSLLIGCSENSPSFPPSQSYTVVTCADYPPFEFLRDGKIVGYDIDLINALATKMGIEIKIQDVTFDGVLGALKSQRADMAISAISATPERRQTVDFSEDYYSTHPVLICSRLTSIQNITDLSGHTIGAQAGSIYEIYANTDLKEKAANLSVKILPRLPELIQDVKNKRLSCIYLGQKEAEGILKNNTELQIINVEEGASSFAIAFPKDSPLREKVNAALQQLKADGTLEKLNQKWL